MSQTIEIGVVVGAHGVAGGLRVRLHDDASSALVPALAIALVGDAGARLDATVRRVARQPGKPGVRLWLDNVSTRDEAERWRGAVVKVDRETLALDDDEYYLADLVGLEVVGHADSPTGAGRPLGRVAGIGSNGVQDLLQIEWHGAGTRHEWMLPALPEFVRSFDDTTVVVDVPPGFLPTTLEADSA